MSGKPIANFDPGASDVDDHRRHNGNAGRLLPHNLEVEEALVGALLLSFEAVASVRERCSPEDLYRPGHKHVVAAVFDLHAAGLPHDPVSVAEELARRGLLEQVGGSGQLLAWQAGCPSTSSAGHYAAVVAEKARLRRLIADASEAIELAYAGSVGAFDRVAQISASAHTASPLEQRMRARLFRGNEILTIPPLNPLVDGLLFRSTFGELYGGWKTFKSFLGLDLSCHLGLGRPWCGRATQPGRVLYLLAEGAGGMQDRYAAWCEYHQVDDVPALEILTMPVSFLDPVEVGALRNLIGTEDPPVLIVVDTLARALVGGDDSSGLDMGKFIANCDLLKDATGACVLALHHVGKDASKGSRGHSSLAGAVDFELLTERAGTSVVLKNPTQRHVADGATFRFDLMPVGGSLVPVYQGEGGDDDTRGLTDSAAVVLRVLRDTDTGSGISPTSLLRMVDEHLAEHGGKPMQERTLRRALKLLSEQHHVMNVGTERRPLYLPDNRT